MWCCEGGKMDSSSSGTSETELSTDVEEEEQHIVKLADGSRVAYKLGGKLLGKGGFGTVREGILTQADGKRVEVAVKCVDKVPKDTLDKHEEEIRVMERLEGHEGIVKFYGGAVVGPLEEEAYGVYMVMELMPMDLMGYIENMNSWSDDLKGYTFGRLLTTISSIAKGLAYLHDNGVVHRDIKPRNVLVSGNGEAKLTDFGASMRIEFDRESITDTGLKGTAGYMAPEDVLYWVCPFRKSVHKITWASDMYSFGVLMLQVISHLQDKKNVRKVCEESEEVVFWGGQSVECYFPNSLTNLIQECVSFTPGAKATRDHGRPMAKDVAERLEVMMSESWANEQVFGEVEERTIEVFVMHEHGEQVAGAGVKLLGEKEVPYCISPERQPSMGSDNDTGCGTSSSTPQEDWRRPTSDVSTTPDWDIDGLIDGLPLEVESSGSFSNEFEGGVDRDNSGQPVLGIHSEYVLSEGRGVVQYEGGDILWVDRYSVIYPCVIQRKSSDESKGDLVEASLEWLDGKELSVLYMNAVEKFWGMDHPNLLKTMEACCFMNSAHVETQNFLVHERFDNDLHSLIFEDAGFADECTYGHIVDILIQVCSGLEHLRRNELIHIDIRPKNILFFASKNLFKLRCSCVLLNLFYGAVQLPQQLPVPMAYMAPETLVPSLFQKVGTLVSDAVVSYSVGVLMWQLLNRSHLNEKSNNVEEPEGESESEGEARSTDGGSGGGKELYDLMEACFRFEGWTPEPSDHGRPSIEAILAELEAMKESEWIHDGVPAYSSK